MEYSEGESSIDSVGCAVPWRCASTRIGYEIHTKNALARIGAEIYLPQIMIHTRRTEYRNSKLMKVPMFPGYLFARLTPESQAAALLGVGTNPRWVDFGEGPVQIPNEIIMALREREENGTIPLDDAPFALQTFSPGDAVEVLTGSFATHKGLFSRDAGRRVIALLQIFNEMREIEFDRDQLARVNDDGVLV